MSYFKKILNNCHEVSILSIKGEKERLSFKNKFELAIHLAFCNCCKNFIQQSEKIDTAIKFWANNNLNQNDTKLSTEFKEKLKIEIKNLN